MDGFLAKIRGSSRAGAEESDAPKPLSPIQEADLQRRVELLDSFEDAGLGWFWATDSAGGLIYLSKNAADQLGQSQAQLMGKPISELFVVEKDEEDEQRSERPLAFQLSARNSFVQHAVKPATRKSEYWWELSGKPQYDAEQNFTGYRGSAKDITATIGSRRDAERMSQFDSLTGLANRHRMNKRLTNTLTAYRSAKRSCALIMLDLDRFKQVNDTLGHPAGDELLRQVAARLKSLIGKKGEIGRLGGDEFQIILPDMDDRGDLGDLGQRIIQMISQPYSLSGSRAVIGTSVGIAVAPYDGVETEELVAAADLALYAAKGGGRGQHRFYSSDLKDSAKYQRQIEEDLRDALAHDQLEVHFQPIVAAKSHEVRCLEALMRWEHPDRGWVSPGEFIPIAEELGLIREIGEWALNKVCQQVTEWPGEVRCAVNVSAVQFAADDFPKIVERALKKSGVHPDLIELEITESVFVGDLERTLDMFKQLKALGVRLALDDFGTGYSSLSYLRDAPFDKIKIDQSFVRGCTEEGNNNSALVSAVVGLAKALGMETVAEGVETEDELRKVEGKGATYIQGAIFSWAVTHEKLLEKFATGDLRYLPAGPARYRSERQTLFKKIGLVHGDHRYEVVLRNLSKTGAKVEGLLDVPVGTDIVLDLGDGQLAVATVRRSHGFSQGVEFETALISDGAEGLCTRHRVSPYQIEAAGKPLQALGNDAYAQLMGNQGPTTKMFAEVDITNPHNRANAM
jgi:diguanylate cyclase (GGDEF)-like protein/PAS domain S-box-containing protein